MRIEIRMVIDVHDAFDLPVATAWISNALERAEPGPMLTELAMEVIER